MLIQDPGKINGKGLFRVLTQLKKDRIILQMNLLGKDYEGLTLITGGYHYALQFLNIDKEDKRPLRKFLYECQREVLKRRSFLIESQSGKV